MVADRAHFGGFLSHDEVTAFTALPHHFFALFEHLLHFDVVQKLEEPFFVCLFDGSHAAELEGEFGEPFFFGVTGELFRRSEANRSNQSGSLAGLLFISIAGAFLAAWIFRAAAAGETVSQFILTLAAAVILFFGTGIVLRYNERRNRV